MTDTPVVYFDTSVYVSVILGEDEPDHQASLTALLAAQQGRFTGLVSALVPAEVVGAPRIRAPQGVPAAEAARRTSQAVEYFERCPFVYVEAGRRAGLRAAEIAKEWNMKGADALHVAIAELSGCTELHTLDADQLKVATGITGLLVRKPRGTAQDGLDFG